MAEEQLRSSQDVTEILDLLRKMEKGGSKDYIGHKPFQVRRRAKVNVNVRISIVRVGDIDTVRQEFQCEFYMRLRWAESRLKGKDISKTTDIKWESLWEPRYHFINAVKFESHETKKEIWDPKSKSEAPQVVYHCYINGTFKEELEVNNFPFDYQDLTLTLASKCKAEMNFVKDPDKDDNIRTENFFSGQEWDLCSHVLTKSLESKKVEGASSSSYPQYKIRMNVMRRYQFYIYNVFFIMFLITAVTFASFAIAADALISRMKITLTLLLTTVAFKYHIQQFLPTVSYLTLIGKYNLSCMVFQIFVALDNTISRFLASSVFLSAFEQIFISVAVLAFVAMNGYFGYKSLKCIKEAKRKIASDKKEYKGGGLHERVDYIAIDLVPGQSNYGACV